MVGGRVCRVGGGVRRGRGDGETWRLGEGIGRMEGWKSGGMGPFGTLRTRVGWLVVCFSIALVACGEGTGEVFQDSGPVAQMTEIGKPTAGESEQPTMTVAFRATAEGAFTEICPVTEPSWAKPPEDDAVLDPPAYGYYYLNEDGSIWASAWWWGQAQEHQPRTSNEGVKVGWFRPEGARLEITGQRLDAEAPALDAHVPCCYPTRFQATGLVFPTDGCWEVTAEAAESDLSFVVWVQP